MAKYTKEELYDMPISKLVDIILNYQRGETEKIFISPTQFDAFFKIRGIATPLTEILDGAEVKRETRGKPRK